MYTSYYKCNEIHKYTNLVSISQSLTGSIKELIHNKCLNIRMFKQLAPSWDILLPYKAGEIDKEEYTRRFTQDILNELNPHQIYNQLGEDAVLLCYEHPSDFCHGHLVSEWFRTNGYDCEEYKPKTLQDNIIETEWEF